MSDIVKKDMVGEGLLSNNNLPKGMPNGEGRVRDLLGNEGAFRYNKRECGHDLELGTQDRVGNKTYFRFQWK